MTSRFPRSAEPNMTKTNRHPGEDTREAGQRKQPIENLARRTRVQDSSIGDQTDGAGDEDRDQRPSFPIDVCEAFWGLVLLGEGGEGA